MSYLKMDEIQYANHTDDDTIDFEVEWDFIKDEINEIAGELKDSGWDYFSAGGYMG